MRKLFSFFFLVHCFFSLLAQKNSDNSNSPNVIVFMVDDLKPNLGIFNDSYSKSPHIDQLGREGMRFNYAYANQAVCVASRYNFMLGKRSTSTGLYNFGVNFRVVYPEMETLPQLFKKNG